MTDAIPAAPGWRIVVVDDAGILDLDNVDGLTDAELLQRARDVRTIVGWRLVDYRYPQPIVWPRYSRDECSIVLEPGEELTPAHARHVLSAAIRTRTP